MMKSQSTISLKLVLCAAVVACAAAGTGVALASASSAGSPGSKPAAATTTTPGTPEAILEGSGSRLRWSAPVVTVQALDSAADCQVASQQDQRLQLLNLTGHSEELAPGGAVLEPNQPVFMACFEHPGMFVYSLHSDQDLKLTVDVVGKGVGTQATVSGILKVSRGTVAELRKHGGTIELNGLPTLERISFTGNGSFDFQVPAGTYELLVWPNSGAGNACGSTQINARRGQHLKAVLTCGS
jgi:hypothetical protein